MTVPNLDDMTEDELMTFWHRYHRPSSKDAEALVGFRYRGFISDTQELANYASTKATAMSCRRQGKIAAALNYESFCDTIYNRLPAHLHW